MGGFLAAAGLRPRAFPPRPPRLGGEGCGEKIAPLDAPPFAASGPFLRRIRSSSVNPAPDPPDAFRIDGGGDLRSEKRLRSFGDPDASSAVRSPPPPLPRRDGYLSEPLPGPFIHGAAGGLTIPASLASADPSPSMSRPRDSGVGKDSTSSSYALRSARVGAGDWRTMSSNLLCTCLASSPLSHPLDPAPWLPAPPPRWPDPAPPFMPP